MDDLISELKERRKIESRVHGNIFSVKKFLKFYTCMVRVRVSPYTRNSYTVDPNTDAVFQES